MFRHGIHTHRFVRPTRNAKSSGPPADVKPTIGVPWARHGCRAATVSSTRDRSRWRRCLPPPRIRPRPFPRHRRAVKLAAVSSPIRTSRAVGMASSRPFRRRSTVVIDHQPRQSQHLDHQSASLPGRSLPGPLPRGSNRRATPCSLSRPVRAEARPGELLVQAAGLPDPRRLPAPWHPSRSSRTWFTCCRRSAGRRVGAPASPRPAEARSGVTFPPSRRSGPSVAAHHPRSGPKPFPGVARDHRSRRRRASRVPVRSIAPKRAGPPVVGLLASLAFLGRPRRVSRTEARSSLRLLPLFARPRRPLPRPLPGRSPLAVTLAAAAPPGDDPSRSLPGAAPRCFPFPQPFRLAGPATSSTARLPPVGAGALSVDGLRRALPPDTSSPATTAPPHRSAMAQVMVRSLAGLSTSTAAAAPAP